MQRAPAHIEAARRTVARRWAVLTLAVAALALLLAPLCTDAMATGGMFTSASAAGTVAGDPHTAMPVLAPPAECAAPASEPVSACAGAASNASATGLSVPGAEQVVLACIAVLVAVLVAVLGQRAPRGMFRTAVPSASPIDRTRLGPPAPRPTLARLCVLRT